MPGKLGEPSRPYRPRDARVLTPYDVVSPDLRSRFSAPVVGLDGGILIPHNVISQEAREQSLLGRFLAIRTMQTGERFAVTHSDEGNLRLHSADPGSWYTSRRMLKYYGVNYGSGPDDKFVRKARLVEHLDEDAAVLSNWATIEASIKKYDAETQWRLYTTIFQNFANDWIGLDYAYRVSGHSNPSAAETSPLISQNVFAGVTRYYELLANPHMVEDGKIKVADLLYLTNASTLLRDMPDDERTDTIRTRTETDHSFQTLAAAQTFMNEFSGRETPPAVVIPMLGGYHLGPALSALGYKGEILPFVAGHKVMDEEGKRRDTDLPIPQSLLTQLAGKEFVIFEDTFLTGSTLTYLTNQLRQAGLEPLALRTMFIGENPPDLKKFPLDLQSKFLAYYENPSGRMVSRGDSMGATIQKRTTRAWARKSEQVGE